MNQYLEHAINIIPTGSQTYSKSWKYFSKPLFAIKGEGGKLLCDDGIEYLDMIMGLGSVILGYKSKEWLLSLDIPSGINFSVPHGLEVKLADKIISMIPSAEMVKYFKNGSDVTAIAVRLARAYTGKEHIACNSYHGFNDWYIASIDRCNGIPESIKLLTHQFKNHEELKLLFETYKNKIAGVIVEPDKGDIREISELAFENNAILIFDEVLTGYRYHLGGLQALFGIIPDMTCLGKCIANGLPLSVLTGKRDIMKLIDSNVFASSTFGGETLALAAALKTIEELEKNGKWLWHLGGKWGSLMDIAIRKKGLTQIMKVVGLSPRCGVKFFDEGGMKAIEFQSLYQQELLKRKILTLGINNFCLDHTDAQIDYFIEQSHEVLDIIGKAYKENNVMKYLDNGVIQTMFRR